MSVVALAIRIEVFRGVFHLLESNARIVPRLGHKPPKSQVSCPSHKGY